MKRKAPAPLARRRRVQRRRLLPRMKKMVRFPMLKTQRTTWVGNWSPNTTTTDGFWKLFRFQYQQITNSGDYTNLFDQYKMYALKYTFVPRFDAFDGANTTDTTQPGVTNQGACRLHIINDPYTTLSPTGTYTSATLNTFLEQGNRVKTYSGNRKVSVFFRTTVNNTLDGLGGGRQRAPWVNVSIGNLDHWGFHAFAQDVNLTGNFGQSWDIFVTAYLVLKNAR